MIKYFGINRKVKVDKYIKKKKCTYTASNCTEKNEFSFLFKEFYNPPESIIENNTLFILTKWELK